MPGGRTKTRITVALDPVLARALDGQARGAGLTRSAAVEGAVSDWLRRRIGEQYGTLERLGVTPDDGRSSGQSEATEARIAAGMVLEALRHQFPAMGELTDEDLRRRAIASQRQARGRR